MLAKKWLAECSDTHTLCNKRHSEEMPTRLLKVDMECVRLVLTKELGTIPHYATLSHCWGRLEFLKLTQDTVQSLMTRVPTEKLPKSFQDAIVATKRLGLDYLWIDCLCIIQDSEDDWVVEAGSMASVYKNSTVTIAAAAAYDGTVGCFVQLPDKLGRIARFSGIFDGRMIKYAFVPNQWHQKSVINSTLASRAWALQGPLHQNSIVKGLEALRLYRA